MVANAMTIPTYEVPLHAAITPSAAGDVLVCASIGPRGDLIALWSAPADEPALRSRTEQPGWASFADPKSPRPVSARVTAHSPRPSLLTQINDLKLAYPFVQPLPGDKVLVVGARSEWRPEGADRNAVIYDAEGRTVAEDVLGDGIEHVLTTTAGDIWVGYFDEGIFGNYGWGSPGPRPVGSCGLIRFSSALQPAWHFSPKGATSISDCYALNVTDDEVWTCYYTGFPIVRVRDGLLTAWRNEVQGPRALAVAGTRVALYGTYGDEPQRLAVGVLDGDRFVVTRTYRLEFPGGGEIPPRTAVFGRGAELHILTSDTWHKVSVNDLPG